MGGNASVLWKIVSFVHWCGIDEQYTPSQADRKQNLEALLCVLYVFIPAFAAKRDDGCRYDTLRVTCCTCKTFGSFVGCSEAQ